MIYAFPLYRLCSYLFPWFSLLQFLPKPCCPDNTQTHFLDSHPSFRVWLGHCLQEACWTPSCWCTCCLLYTFMFGAHSHLKTNTENSWGKGALFFFPFEMKGQSLCEGPKSASRKKKTSSLLEITPASDKGAIESADCQPCVEASDNFSSQCAA